MKHQITAQKIMEAFPGLTLSGSLSLVLQGYKTRREPVDLDFAGEIWNPSLVPGLQTLKVDHDEYGDVKYELLELDGIKINVFRDELEFKSINVNGLDCLKWNFIIGKKLWYCSEDSATREKHLEDVRYFLSNNQL